MLTQKCYHLRPKTQPPKIVASKTAVPLQKDRITCCIPIWECWMMTYPTLGAPTNCKNMYLADITQNQTLHPQKDEPPCVTAPILRLHPPMAQV